MAKGPNGTRIDWTAVATLIASAGILVIGLLLNSLNVSSAVKAAAIILTVAILGAFSAGFAAWRASSRVIAEVKDESLDLLHKFISASDGHVQRTERELEARHEQLQSELDTRLTKNELAIAQSLMQFTEQVVPSLQRLEATVLDYLVTNPVTSTYNYRHVTQIGVTEVTAIEDHASEVWVYGVELKWDAADSPFARIMERNLQERVHYRYLVPDTEDALAAVSAIQRRLRRIKDLDKFLTFKVRRERYPLGLLGFSLYNPTYEKGEDEISGLRVTTCMVQFPRSAEENSENSFIRLSGLIVREHEAAFYQAWQSATPC